MRFLLIDQILELDRGRRARGVKNVAMSEDFLAHHFPGTPIMPGALIAEAALQLANWVIREESDFERSGLLVHLETVRFREIVRPGDQLDLEVERLETMEERVRFGATARCTGKLVASGRFVLEIVDTVSLEAIADARRQFEALTARLGEEGR